MRCWFFIDSTVLFRRIEYVFDSVNAKPLAVLIYKYSVGMHRFCSSDFQPACKVSPCLWERDIKESLFPGPWITTPYTLQKSDYITIVYILPLVDLFQKRPPPEAVRKLILQRNK